MMIIIFIIIGAIFGSFLHAWASRRSSELSIVHGRSRCLSCKQELKWYDNIPVLSFLYLRGACRSCQKKIPRHTVMVEVVGMVIFGLLGYHAEITSMDLSHIILFSAITLILLAVFTWDIVAMEIPDVLTLWPVPVFFALLLFLNERTWIEMLFGIFLIAGFFLLQYVFSKGAWIGGGDVRLGVLMGVILGWKLGLFALFFAYIVGALISVFLLILKKKILASEVPFGTYLSVATVVALVFGENVWVWYIGLLK